MVRAADGARIVVVERGLMARSADNGDSWQLLPQVYDGSFFGVLALKSKALLAFGMRGHVFRSGDDGKSWQESKVPTGRSEARRVGKECVSTCRSRVLPIP